MLVLTRKTNQTIMIGDGIEVTVLSISAEKVRLGIKAPRDVPVFREEATATPAEAQAGARRDGEGAAPANP